MVPLAASLVASSVFPFRHALRPRQEIEPFFCWQVYPATKLRAGSGPMQDYEKLGVFYLGREYDAATRAPSDNLLLYDSRDLTTHAVCVGMTGSGKTGLCLALLEEAGIDGIPAICIDPKGDLGNLLLTFPHLQAAEFLSWIDPGEAQRKGLSVEQYAAQTAETWKKGLAEWGQPPEGIQKFVDAVDL